MNCLLNFSKTMVEEDVRDLFKEYGHIEELTILKENGKSKGKNSNFYLLNELNLNCLIVQIK